MVTVLAPPINLIAGLFGMNVGGIPLAQYCMFFVDCRRLGEHHGGAGLRSPGQTRRLKPTVAPARLIERYSKLTTSWAACPRQLIGTT